MNDELLHIVVMIWDSGDYDVCLYSDGREKECLHTVDTWSKAQQLARAECRDLGFGVFTTERIKQHMVKL